LDLYVPEKNFVFGLSDLPGSRSLIALSRLRQRFYCESDDEVLFFSRVVKEAVHELGHSHGLRHCSNSRCVMCFSESIEDTDYKEQDFCPVCRGHVRC
ncbi:MAG TPA: hypothetical protein VK503_01235, partial [Candidatus Bathyarchaeia archaeon]|nr:hypothetical protein [Candidatus Bathyarchaeia archaeon]